MIPICTRPGAFVICIDAFNTPLRKGQRYEVDKVLVGFDYFEGRDGYGVVLKGVAPPQGMIAFNRRRFIEATLPVSLTQWLNPKPYGERPDPA